MRFAELRKDKTFRKVITIFIALKIFIFLFGVASPVIFRDISNIKDVTNNTLLNPWAQYDARAYLFIAENGYSSNMTFGAAPTNYHFYPMYPLLIRSIGFIGYPLAAFLISNIASILAITVLYMLAKEEFGDVIAKKSALYIMLFPTAYYFVAMYTEPLFLLFSATTFYYARHRKWALAGLAGFAAALTRGPGIMILFPIAYMYLNSRKFSFRKINLRTIDRNILYLGLIPLGFLTFAAYQLVAFGNAFIQFESFRAWGTKFGFPWEGAAFSVKAIITDGTLVNVSYHVFNLALFFMFIYGIYLSLKLLGKEYAIYSFFVIAPAIFSGTLQGLPRYSLVVFPVFMAYAAAAKNKKADMLLKVLCCISLLLMLAFVMLHVNERFVSGSFIFFRLF